MEFEEEENGFHGSVPELGAIFMSNIATKRICFKKKVLGLPLSKANFVKRVKCGMILFLFEFEKRELFGVYRATSDGGVNIAPHAFSSPGDCYPAQVHFTPIWYCSPLSEPEFRGAIRDNYYSAKKFNFGLSRDQVRSLLMLFSTRNESQAVSNGFLNEDCAELNGDTRSRGDRIEDEYRVSFSERECLNNNCSDYDGILMNSIADNRLKNHPLTTGMRLAEGSQFLMDGSVNTDYKNLPTVISSNELADPVYFSGKNRSIIFANSERIVNQSNTDCGSGMTRLTEQYGELSNGCTSTLAARYGRSTLNDGLEELHNLDYISGKFDCDFGNILRNANSQHRLIHDSTENKHLKDYIAVSSNPSARLVSPSCDIDELYGDARSPVSWNRREHSLDNFGGPGFHGRRNEYSQSLIRDRRVHGDTLEFDLGPSASNEQPAFRLNVDNQWANVDCYRENNPEKGASTVEYFHMPRHMIGSDPHTEMKHLSPTSCSISFSETTLPQITEAVKFDPSFSNCQDATVTRALPCNHELATSHYGHSSSSQVDLVEQNLDVLPKDGSMPYREKVGDSTVHPDFAADHRQRARLHLQSGFGESHLNAEFSENERYRDPPSLRPYMTFPVVKRPGEASLQGEYAGFAPLAFDSSSHPSFATDSPMPSRGIRERVALQESDGILYHSGVPDHFDIYETIAVNDVNEHSRSSHPDYEKIKRRRSVFTRLSSKKCTLKEKEIDYVTRHDKHFMDASVDEVMGMQQTRVFLAKKQMKCKSSVESHDNGEIAIHEMDHNPSNSSPKKNKRNGHHSIEQNVHHNPSTNSSPKKNKRNGHHSIEQNDHHHAPKETRALDFKRRSELKKSLHDSETKDHLILHVGLISSETSVVKDVPGSPSKHKTLTKDVISEKMPSENEPANKLAKRRKLVRPVFWKTDSSNAKSQDVGSTNKLLSSGRKHRDPNRKQSLSCVLENSSDPHDSSSLKGSTNAIDPLNCPRAQ